jgi:hypothetical protein
MAQGISLTYVKSHVVCEVKLSHKSSLRLDWDEKSIKLFAHLRINGLQNIIGLVPSTAWTVDVALGMELIYEETKVLQSSRLSAKVLQ